MESLEISVENLGNLKRKLQITVPKEAVQKIYNKSYNDLKNKVNIPGFRKGSYPQALLEKRFKKHMSQEALETLVPEYFQKALEQEKLEPVGRPHFTDLEIDKKKPLVFTATFELRPEFDLPEYSSFQIERKEIDVTQEDIDKQRESHLEHAATFQPTDEPISENNEIIVDYKPITENEHIPAKENFYLRLGTKALGPEVDEALIGMKSGDEKVIDVTYPSDHAVEELQGTAAKMSLKVNEVKTRTMPELNEQFFSRFNGVKTEDDFEGFLKEEVTQMKTYENTAGYRKELKEQLAEKLDFDLPEQILADEVSRRLKQAKEANKDESKTDEEIRAEVEKTAKEELRFSFYIQHILESEKLKVDEQEVGKRFQMNCMFMGMNPQELIEQEYGRQIYQQTHAVIAEETAMDFVTNKIFES
jgi:trigger factor